MGLGAKLTAVDFEHDPHCEDTEELEALREDEADVLVAHADGQMTSADYAECIALAVATGWRPRCLRTTTRITDAERAAPTLRPEAL